VIEDVEEIVTSFEDVCGLDDTEFLIQSDII
jgi:hypothetical protein